MPAQEMPADKIIALIYAAAHNPAKWQEVVCALRMYFDATQVCFGRTGPDATTTDFIAAKHDPYFDALFLREFANDTTLIAKLFARLPFGIVFGEHNYIDREQIQRERFWKEWLAPQDMYFPLGSKLCTDGISTWYVIVDRGQHSEAYSKDDIARMERLVPHFVNAIRMGLELAANRASSATLSQVHLGVIIAAPDLRILYANDLAEQILGHPGNPISRNASGQIMVSDRNKAPELTQAIADAVADDSEKTAYLLLQSRNASDGDYSIAVSPLGSRTDIFAHSRQAVLTIRRLAREAPEDFEHQLRALFGLSVQEARVAAKLAYGQTVKDVADGLQISIPTTRSHLASLFRKTKTAQQSQLVALLRASIP